MTHTVTAGDRKITYELTRKKVKNINLRIKPAYPVCKKRHQKLCCGF